MPGKHVIEPGEYAGLNRSINRVFSLFDRRRRSAPGSFFTTSTTSRINAFPRLQFLDPAAQSLRVIIIGCGRPAAGVRGLIALRGVPVFGLQRGHAALAVRPDPAMHRADAHAELFGGLLLLHAAQHQLDCPSPGLQWDDGFGHMASIPGIHRQPTLQTLPGRITQMLHHLGRRHRRGEIQLHRTLSFLKTGHTKIFPFGLQENVRSPMSDLHCANCTSADLAISPCTIPLYKYDTNRTFATISSRSMHRELGRYGVRVSALRCAEVCMHNLLAFVNTACDSAMLALRQGGESNH